MLLQQAGIVYWKKWAAKRECEELKESIWLRRRKGGLKNTETWPENWYWKEVGCSRNSDESAWQTCHKEEGTEKHRLHNCPEWHEIRREIPEVFRTWEQKMRKLQRKSGGGREVLSRTLSVKASGTGATSA